MRTFELNTPYLAPGTEIGTKRTGFGVDSRRRLENRWTLISQFMKSKPMRTLTVVIGINK